ncbi:hypothetical protein [Pseudolactococcus raffinolactis]|uniref:hypothetical protein n=1 Tax=Pseudolactococcus raffinolactis TaxID=1366 RepID=UPI002415CF7A|nr:hypothetical protein [Lactococcus raffinolactis]MDG4961521.1 hypothetical protein [Lactococcus raffinolactis]
MLAIVISIISISLSIATFCIKIFNRRFNLGISVKNLIANDEKELLFSKISFINNSDKPITIISMTFLNNKSEKYRLLHSDKHDYECEYGSSISISDSVEFKFNRTYKDYSEKSYTLPITIQSQSSFSGYFAFNFTHQSSYSPVYNEGYVEVETTDKTIIHKYTPKNHTVSELVNGKMKAIDFRWYQGPIMTKLPKYLKSFRIPLINERQ